MIPIIPSPIPLNPIGFPLKVYPMKSSSLNAWRKNSSPDLRWKTPGCFHNSDITIIMKFHIRDMIIVITIISPLLLVIMVISTVFSTWTPPVRQSTAAIQSHLAHWWFRQPCCTSAAPDVSTVDIILATRDRGFLVFLDVKPGKTVVMSMMIIIIFSYYHIIILSYHIISYYHISINVTVIILIIIVIVIIVIILILILFWIMILMMMTQRKGGMTQKEDTRFVPRNQRTATRKVLMQMSLVTAGKWHPCYTGWIDPKQCGLTGYHPLWSAKFIHWRSSAGLFGQLSKQDIHCWAMESSVAKIMHDF